MHRSLPAMAAAVALALPALAQKPVRNAEPVRMAFERYGQTGDTIYWYVGAPVSFSVTLAPGYDGLRVSGGARVDRSDEAHTFRGVLKPCEGTLPLCAQARRGRAVAETCSVLVAFYPQMRGDLAAWGALASAPGSPYDPSSEWMIRDATIPNASYQTVVDIDGRVVLDRPGTRFTRDDLPAVLHAPSTVLSIRTRVYWRPPGAIEPSQWLLLASTAPDPKAFVAPMPVR